jgi:hydroxysqualene dehydroxylase
VGHRVAVVGAGWAGLAAAATLAEHGVPVTVFEASRSLGGRARRVTLEGIDLDNGQHILIGAYGETLRLMRLVGADPERLLVRLPLELRDVSGFRLRAPPLPAPLHLLAALVLATGLTLAERLAAARFVAALRRSRFAVAADQSVDQLLARHDQTGALRDRLWVPLCVSALNTPPDRASARVFANVLRDTLGGGRAASDLLLPKADLGALFPAPAAAFVAARGGEIRLGAAVRGVARDGAGFRLDPDPTAFGRVILACPPQHAPALLGDLPELGALAAALAAIEHEPIYTCYLQYPDDVSLPFPMLGFSGGLAQWAFDRGALSGHRGLIAVVLSASGGHEALAHAELAATIHAELAGAFPGLPEPRWHRVIAERRATFSCRPGLGRPGNATPVPGLVLAGDYTASDYPATLESAIRSGVAAANLVSASLNRAPRAHRPAARRRPPGSPRSPASGRSPAG